MQIPLGGLILSAAVGFFVTIAAVALPARNASRISPLEALRARGIPKESWLVRHGWLPGVVIVIVSYWLIEASPFPPEIQYQLVSIPVFGLFVGAALLVPVTVGPWERASRPLVRLIYGS